MRNLDWDGLRNLRDLGGLPTALSPTGTTVMARIARGPRREQLTAAGWRAATRWGLRSIVDLRNPDEVGIRESDPGAHPPADVTVTFAPTEDQSNPEFREICFPILDSPEYWSHNARILPSLIRNALEAIAAAQPGVLVHCAAGRDRTGMISALLLANAGVRADDIVADYAESVWAIAGTPHGGASTDRQASWTPDQVRDWLGDVTHFVREFFAEPDTLFDSLEVSTETRRTLRRMLTVA